MLVNEKWFEIWSDLFRMNKRVFRKKGYEFMRQISTDGVGCSILFIKEEYYEPYKAMRSKNMSKPKFYKEDRYVSDLSDKEKKEMLSKKIIAKDPGKENLFEATDGKIKLKKKKNKIFRKTKRCKYTNKQRIHETKSAIYRKQQLKIKKIKDIKVYDNEKRSIEEIESKLSKYNSSTCDFMEFMKFLKLKLIVNDILLESYEREIWRKYKWFSFINVQRSEQKMVNNFKDKFGGPDEVCILIGDWDERGQEASRALRGQPPTKGVGLRRVFKRAGYKNLFLVNEYNTSCRLYETGEKMYKCRNKRTPLALRMLHGYKEDDGSYGISKNNKDKQLKDDAEFEQINIISRDLNGSLNILLKGRCILEGKPIPKYMDPAYKGTKYQA